jgi:hypothetical protein
MKISFTTQLISNEHDSAIQSKPWDAGQSELLHQPLIEQIHFGIAANVLKCKAGGDGFAPHLLRYLSDLFFGSIRSLVAERDVK